MRIVRFSFIVVILSALVLINTIYFFNTRQTLIEHQNQKTDVLMDSITRSIQSEKRAELFFNNFMAEELRISSIAIRNALPPSIKDVKESDLKRLTKELNLQGITLFVQKGDDIVGAKSNLPEQIGLSTKGWAKGMWYKMFHQLLEKHNVTLIEDFGEKQENFWSGPIDTSSANPDMVSKWGYYNDGTTDYLIDPFMSDDKISKYRKDAGVEHAINQAEEKRNSVLDVSVINATALIKGEHKTRDTGIVWLSDRMKVYGDYSYSSKRDIGYVKDALRKKEPVSEIFKVDGKEMLKTYYPIPEKNGDNIDDDLFIIIASDYSLIQQELTESLTKQVLISIIVFLIAFSGLYVSFRLITKRERTIFNVQEIYTNHIQSLFKTVREQRHDANHHIYTIAGLLKLKAYEELSRYVETLVTLEEPTRTLVDVNIPALSGLLQSKMSEANEKGIDFEYHFENMEQVNLKLEKVTDLVRSAGNIIDNAFHAVNENPITKSKKVWIHGIYKNKELTISIQNNGAPIQSSDLMNIFSFGFTSRKNKGGSGIGLASSKKSLERYGGKLSVVSEEGFTRFTILLPVSSKEISTKI